MFFYVLIFNWILSQDSAAHSEIHISASIIKNKNKNLITLNSKIIESLIFVMHWIKLETKWHNKTKKESLYMSLCEHRWTTVSWCKITQRPKSLFFEWFERNKTISYKVWEPRKIRILICPKAIDDNQYSW